MKRFFANWAGGFVDGTKAMRALPWLVAGMIAIELVQHVIEVRTGFFSTDPAMRKAASMAPERMALGWPKMFATWGLAFFAVRFLVLGNAGAALRVPALAWRRYAGVVLFQLVPALAIIYAEPILAAALPLRRDVPYACRDGVCGTCRAKVESGQVVMERCSALSRGDRKAGYVLACVAHPVTEQVTLDFDA